MTRIFFSAGESSGDIHGAAVIRSLREIDPSVECEGLGGVHMAEAGMELHYDLAGQAIMGFVEVVRRFGMVHKLFLETVRRIEASPPDCIVLVDYPGFNLQLAKRAALMGIPVVYYISPQVWAWKRRRIYTIAEVVKKMLVILPFEAELYSSAGVDCTYVGHPLLDHVANTAVEGRFRNGTVVAVMPGSREQEIERLLRPMLETAAGIRKHYPDARFVTPCVNAEREAQVRRIAEQTAPGFPLETMIGDTYELLDGARLCLVASGTATLEVALHGVPMIVMYKVAWLSYWIARYFVKIKNIALVNILVKETVAPEMIQDMAEAEHVLPLALELMEDGPRRKEMLRDLESVRQLLGGPGASERAAAEILKVARGESDE